MKAEGGISPGLATVALILAEIYRIIPHTPDARNAMQRAAVGARQALFLYYQPRGKEHGLFKQPRTREMRSNVLRLRGCGARSPANKQSFFPSFPSVVRLLPLAGQLAVKFVLDGFGAFVQHMEDSGGAGFIGARGAGVAAEGGDGLVGGGEYGYGDGD